MRYHTGWVLLGLPMPEYRLHGLEEDRADPCHLAYGDAKRANPDALALIEATYYHMYAHHPELRDPQWEGADVELLCVVLSRTTLGAIVAAQRLEAPDQDALADTLVTHCHWCRAGTTPRPDAVRHGAA